MSSRQFIPIEPEERFVVTTVKKEESTINTIDSQNLQKGSRKNFYTNELAQARKTRSKTLFHKAISCLRSLFTREDERYSVEEMDQMIEHFQRAIQYLREEKIDQMKQRG